MCPCIMRSEPPKKNKWLNRKPLDKPTDLWYNEYSQEGKRNGMVAKWETDGPHG